MRLKPFVTSLITVLCALFFMRAAPAEVVSIWDEDLRAAILKKLNKPNPKAAITTSDMLHLTELRLEDVGFSTLTGLEHATNLKTLYLSWDTAVHPRERGSYPSDVSPIATLTQLKTLVLNHSNIKDVSPLAKLTQLTELRLAFSNIVDVSPLAKLKNLTVLDLNNYHDVDNNNGIVDVSPLATLTHLIELNLAGNQISDVSSLTGLTNLTALNLTYNNIVDVSPLVNLKNLTRLELNNNDIVDVSPLATLTHLIGMTLRGNRYRGCGAARKLEKPDRVGPEWQRHRRCAPLANLTQLMELGILPAINIRYILADRLDEFGKTGLGW